MALLTPRYIERSRVQDATLSYRWDDWKVEDAYEPVDEAFVARMAKLSYRANIAFTAACAEWIVFRYGGLSKDTTPTNYIEAAWAAIVNWRYARYFEPNDNEWQGPVRRAIAAAMVLTVEVIGRTESHDLPEISSASISNLAKHVMSQPGPFEEWQEWGVQQLARFYSRNEQEPLGDVVPREALDPDVRFLPSDTVGYISRFLKNLDRRGNHFLEAPDAMLEMGFEGTPYSYP